MWWFAQYHQHTRREGGGTQLSLTVSGELGEVLYPSLSQTELAVQEFVDGVGRDACLLDSGGVGSPCGTAGFSRTRRTHSNALRWW